MQQKTKGSGNSAWVRVPAPTERVPKAEWATPNALKNRGSGDCARPGSKKNEFSSKVIRKSIDFEERQSTPVLILSVGASAWRLPQPGLEKHRSLIKLIKTSVHFERQGKHQATAASYWDQKSIDFGTEKWTNAHTRNLTNELLARTRSKFSTFHKIASDGVSETSWEASGARL